MINKKIVSIIILIAGIAVMSMAFKENIHGQVVCFGDSITYGTKVDKHSWVWFLSKTHPEIHFINAGRSGRKTADKEELLPVLKKYSNADYYLIFLGVNDLKDGTNAQVNNCIQNMKWMISRIQATDPKAKVVILSPPDINLKTMSQVNIQKKYNQNTRKGLFQLEKKYEELSQEEHVFFISLLHAVSKPNYVDGLHPNIEGQEQIANTVWKGLNKLH